MILLKNKILILQNQLAVTQQKRKSAKKLYGSIHHFINFENKRRENNFDVCKETLSQRKSSTNDFQ